jgi:2-keto-4-pentenoate hydratase/2-oxohepta-3-ene-1,7-dioic acid hydratase in catechol pathway
MRLATITHFGREEAALVAAGQVLPLAAVNRACGTAFATDLYELIRGEQLASLGDWYRSEGHQRCAAMDGEALPETVVRFAPLYRRPGKIWGIGLNYREHAGDLDAPVPTGAPASFMKPTTTIIGPGETIRIPRLSERTTAEAELGVIIGRRCKDVSVAEAPAVIAGYTTILDMTAEDILQRNPRYLTLSKSFDSFFSFGPMLLTPDEVGAIDALEVATIHNGRVHRQNRVANMTFRPFELIAFHSQVMTLLPGDIISTGTPGAVRIADGDVVECRIAGFPALVNPVIDLKTSHQGAAS